MLYLWTVSWDTGIHKETNSRKIVIYTRVSTSNQKNDLKNQYIRFYNDAIKECVFLDINKIVKEVNCFENEI